MNPLTDLVPPKARKYVYAALALGGVAYSAYTASNGDWGQFVGSLVVTLGNSLAASNVNDSADGE